MYNYKKNKSWLGLDITDEYIKFVESRFVENKCKVYDFDVLDRGSFNKQKFKIKDAIIGLDANSAIIEIIKINPNEQRELHKNILSKAQNQLKLSLSKLRYDFKLLNDYELIEGSELENLVNKNSECIHFIFVAAPISVIEQKVNEVLSIGFRPQGIDLDIFARHRALKYLKHNTLNIKSKNAQFYPDSFLLALGLSMQVTHASN